MAVNKKNRDKVVTKPADFLAKTKKATGVTLRKTAKGEFYIHTQRDRSGKYKSIAAISKSVIELIESTG